MFTWLNKQGVKSSDGFILQSMNRYFYHYIEGNYQLQVDVEPLRDKSNHYYEEIYLDSLTKWLPPNDSIKIASEDMKRIRENISAALMFMGIKHKFK